MGEDSNWHLDKRVPLVLIVTILIQTGGAIWWAAAVDGRLISVEKRMAAAELTNRRQYERMNTERAVNSAAAERLARVEGLLESINEQVRSIVVYVIKGAK